MFREIWLLLWWNRWWRRCCTSYWTTGCRYWMTMLLTIMRQYCWIWLFAIYFNRNFSNYIFLLEELTDLILVWLVEEEFSVGRNQIFFPRNNEDNIFTFCCRSCSKRCWDFCVDLFIQINWNSSTSSFPRNDSYKIKKFLILLLLPFSNFSVNSSLSKWNHWLPSSLSGI
jgi:hypothetical protein